MAGEYAELVRLAQADDDPPRRQQAMHAIAQAAPHAGGDSTGADTIARAALATIYPAENPQPSPEVHNVIAEIEAAAVRRFEQFLADALSPQVRALRRSENRTCIPILFI